MKTLQTTVFLLATTIVLSPLIPLWVGDYYEYQMEETQDEDKISKWRNARLFYRQAQMAPWLWLSVEKRKRNIDQHLSQSMYEIILIGESGAFDADQHLDFIQSREDTSTWQVGATEALYRYGDCDDIVEAYEKGKNTVHSQKVDQITLLCAMQLDNQDLFDEVYERNSGWDGLAFWASKPKGKYRKLLEARSNPTDENWSDFIQKTSSNEQFQQNLQTESQEDLQLVSPILLPLWIESYAQINKLKDDYEKELEKKSEELAEISEETETNVASTVIQDFSEEILYSLLSATISQDIYPNTNTVLSLIASEPYEPVNLKITKDISDCMILSSAQHVPQEQIQKFTQDVLDGYLQENYLPSRLEIHHMNKCNAQYYYDISERLMDLYHKQTAESDLKATQSYLSAQWWLLLGARSQLGTYNISKSQNWLKQFDSQNVQANTESSEELKHIIEKQRIMYLYLRSLAREFAGDLSGIEKYARQLKEMDSSLSVLRMGKANLLRQQKAETIWILFGEKELSLPENLKQEHTDLAAIAQRMNGSGNKMILNGEEIKYGLLERSTDFRVWYANHLNELLHYPHTNISTLNILINNARADKDGPSLLQSHFDSEIHLQSILLRQHLIFLFNSFKGNNTNDSWNDFSTVQKRWEVLPFPQLWIYPEFQVQLEEIVDFEALIADL
jgi:hypothetical protein